jgi:type IV secretion system protein TrbB
VILEEVPELQCAASDKLCLRTSASADLQTLLRTTLRLRPDRIIAGEVRGAEALAMLKAWNTGHPGGLSTIHSNVTGARAALLRLELLIAESGQVPMRELIAEAVNVIVSIGHDPALGRRIREVARVCGFDGRTYTLQPVESDPA